MQPRFGGEVEGRGRRSISRSRHQEVLVGLDLSEHSDGCQCGAVSYAATGRPSEVIRCDCATCRRDSGSGVPTFACFDDDGVMLLEGRVLVYGSSELAQRGFCAKCGSSIFLDYGDQPGRIWLRVGSVSAPERETATSQWCLSDEPWWKPIRAGAAA